MSSSKVLNLFFKIRGLLACPPVVYTIIISISVFALAGALISQHVFGLEPCILCLYQRIPYALAIGAGLGGLLLKEQGSLIKAVPSGLCIFIFLTNFIIATHHVGVEQKWWQSYAEGCSMQSIQGAANKQELLRQILSAPAVPCDKIPWVDPIFGQSMAVYNALLSFGMAVFSVLACYFIFTYRRRKIDILT